MAIRPRLARRGRREQVTIPEPTLDQASHRAAIMAMKELIEVLAGQRGQAMDAAVTWQDLLDLQMVRYEEIPLDIGSKPFGPPV